MDANGENREPHVIIGSKSLVRNVGYCAAAFVHVGRFAPSSLLCIQRSGRCSEPCNASISVSEPRLLLSDAPSPLAVTKT